MIKGRFLWSLVFSSAVLVQYYYGPWLWRKIGLIAASTTKKVHVYSIPEDLLYHSYNMRPETCPFGMYSAEIVVPELIKRHERYYQPDPEKANVFVVPQFSSCYYHLCISQNESPDVCKHRVQEYFERILDWVEDSFPYWSRKGGSDHVFVFTWDQGSEILGIETDIVNRISSSRNLVHHGQRSNDASQNYNPKKDIVIPPYRDTHEIDRIFKDNFVKKTIFTYFRGAILENAEYGDGIRTMLRELGNAYPDKYFVKEDHSIFYWQEIARARFAFCPPGWSVWSPRLFDAVNANAIPVLFNREWILPFEDHIDYASFTIVTDFRDIDKTLSSISDEEYKKMVSNLEKYKNSLRYNNEPIENDAVDLILRKLVPPDPGNSWL